MPIFEFRCLECGNVFEKLFMASEKKVDLACPACQRQDCERVVSRCSHVLGAGPSGRSPQITTKSCGPGSQCTTLDLPGYSK